MVVLSAYVFGNISLAVPLRHRRALRSEDRQGRGRQELLLPALAHGRDDVLREQGVQSVHGCARRGDGARRRRRRQFRSLGARLPRRRALCLRPRRRPSDRLPAGAARHAALGRGLEEGDGEMVPPRRQHRRVRLELRQPQQLSRPRPDLQGPARAAAAAAHLQFRRERLQGRWNTRSMSRPRSRAR